MNIEPSNVSFIGSINFESLKKVAQGFGRNLIDNKQVFIPLTLLFRLTLSDAEF